MASALEDLDRKVELGLTLTKGKGWADRHVDHAVFHLLEGQAEELPYWSQVSTVAE